MKKIFLILIAAFAVSKSFSQNVGIGTTTPAFKLDVRSGSINTDSLYRISDIPVISVKGRGNFFAGKNAGGAATGSSNTAAGDSSLYLNTSGYSNTAIGRQSLYFNTTGFSNTACGYFTLHANTSGQNNIAVGHSSLLANTIGANNVAVGNQALNANISGSSNTANGIIALALNTTGVANTGIGSATLHANVTGSYNTALGYFADVSSSNLTAATAIGSYANTHCSNCLTLGGVGFYHTNVGINNTTPLTDLHIIQHTDAGGDKLRGIRLQRFVNNNHWRTLIDPSNNYVFEYNDGLYTYINPITGNYVNSSDARLKKDITPLEIVLDKVMALTPKKFHYKTNSADDPLLWGFIAQDVQKIFPEFVDVKDDGYLGIAYSNFSIVAIKAIQEQQNEIEELKNMNALQQNHNAEMESQIELQQKEITEMKKQIESLLNK